MQAYYFILVRILHDAFLSFLEVPRALAAMQFSLAHRARLRAEHKWIALTQIGWASNVPKTTTCSGSLSTASRCQRSNSDFLSSSCSGLPPSYSPACPGHPTRVRRATKVVYRYFALFLLGATSRELEAVQDSRRRDLLLQLPNGRIGAAHASEARVTAFERRTCARLDTSRGCSLETSRNLRVVVCAKQRAQGSRGGCKRRLWLKDRFGSTLCVQRACTRMRARRARHHTRARTQTNTERESYMHKRARMCVSDCGCLRARTHPVVQPSMHTSALGVVCKRALALAKVSAFASTCGVACNRALASTLSRPHLRPHVRPHSLAHDHVDVLAFPRDCARTRRAQARAVRTHAPCARDGARTRRPARRSDECREMPPDRAKACSPEAPVPLASRRRVGSAYVHGYLPPCPPFDAGLGPPSRRRLPQAVRAGEAEKGGGQEGWQYQGARVSARWVLEGAWADGMKVDVMKVDEAVFEICSAKTCGVGVRGHSQSASGGSREWKRQFIPFGLRQRDTHPMDAAWEPEMAASKAGGSSVLRRPQASALPLSGRKSPVLDAISKSKQAGPHARVACARCLCACTARERPRFLRRLR
eukprot:4773842-Pleurochrysis_carterae.AAC.2